MADYTVGGNTGVTFDPATGRGTIMISYGSATVTLTPTHDTRYEGPESAILAIEPPPAEHTLGTPASATGTIADDDPPPAAWTCASRAWARPRRRRSAATSC